MTLRRARDIYETTVPYDDDNGDDDGGGGGSWRFSGDFISRDNAIFANLIVRLIDLSGRVIAVEIARV